MRFIPTILAITVAVLVLSPVSVEAQGLQNAARGLETVGKAAYGETAQADPVLIVGRVINIFLSILGVIFLFLTVYGGYLWMTARGDEQQVTKAKDTLRMAIIGLAITLGAYAISNFVVSRLVSETTGAESVE